MSNEELSAEIDRLRRIFVDGFDVQRVLEWQLSDPRKLATLAFTAGGERSAAQLIEDEHARQTAVIEGLRGELAESAPYWLCHALAEHVAKECRCDTGSMMRCSQRQLCVTEYCPRCAADWWLEQQAAIVAVEKA